MATLKTNNPTLADVVGRMDSAGNIPDIVEMLKQTNDILEDATVIEANGVVSHKSIIRSGLPEGTWRKLNYGVQPEKSTTVSVEDTVGSLETYAEVDKALADLNGNSASWRLSEERAFIEGLNQTMAATVIYGNSGTKPEAFTGLAPRFNSLSAENGGNIINAGGTGNKLSSIWLTTWSPNTLHLIYPKGSQAGLQTRDLGETTLTDPAGGHYQGYRTHYVWKNGLVLRDWRYVVRIANIDVASLTKDGKSGADLIDLMTQALELLPSETMGRNVFYVPKQVRSFLRRQIVNKVSSSTLGMDEVAGKHVITFDSVPVRRVDALSTGESQVK